MFKKKKKHYSSHDAILNKFVLGFEFEKDQNYEIKLNKTEQASVQNKKITTHKKLKTRFRDGTTQKK